MRLLHARHADHPGRVPARQSGPDRGGGAHRHLGQPVPLHRLSEHRGSGARCGQTAARPPLAWSMTFMNRISATARILFILSAGVPCIPGALADDQIKLAVGARGNWETAAAELGQNAGFFRKRGLVLDLLYTQGSGETQQAVISGSVAIGVGLGTTSVMNAFAKGAPLRAIGNASTGSSEYWYVPANSPLQSMKDAAGSPIAYPTVGASSHLEVLGFLKYYGLDAKPIGTGGTAATFTQAMSG